MGKDNEVWLSAKAVLLLYFLSLFAFPLAAILLRAFEGINLQSAIGLVAGNSGVIWNSFLQASISTVFSVLLGVLAAFLVSRRDFPGRGILKAASLVPFVFPSILVVLSFVILLGNNGWANSFLRNFLNADVPIQFLYGLSGIVIAHAFYNFPLVMRFVSDAWDGADNSAREAARTLGAGRFGVFLKITLPELLPAIFASALLVFIYCFTSFTIVLSLGSLNFSTIEVEIFSQLSRRLDFGSAAVLAIAQFALLCIPVLLYTRLSKTAFRHSSSVSPRKKLNPRSAWGLLEALALAAIFAFVLLPIISLVAFAFFGSGEFSLNAFEKIIGHGPSLTGTTPMLSIFYSLLLGSIACVAATLMALLASLRRARVFAADFFLGTSVAVSVIVLGFGYLVGFGSGNLIVIALAHSILAFPFAVRIISGALSRIDLQSLEAARTLGANELQVLQLVQLPRIKGAILASLAFSFAVSLGELGIVMLLYDGVYATMPVYVYRLISAFDIPAAAAMGLLMVLISFVCFHIIERSGEGIGATA